MVFLPNNGSLICFIAPAPTAGTTCSPCGTAFRYWTPQEQLTGSNAMLTGDQHGHSGLKLC